MGESAVEVTGFVLMAGAGSRLKSVFPNLPKPLVLVEGIPMGVRIIRQMADAGISRIIVNLHHDAKKIQAGIAREIPSSIEILWAFEESVLGTGGGILHAGSFFSQSNILVVATCDILTGFDLKGGLRRHETSGEKISLVLSPEGPQSEVGRIALTSGGGVAFPPLSGEGFSEGEIPHFFTGIHFLTPDVLFDLGKGLAVPFSVIDLYRKHLAMGGFIRADVTGESWLDLGTEDGYRRHEAFLEGLRRGGERPER